MKAPRWEFYCPEAHLKQKIENVEGPGWKAEKQWRKPDPIRPDFLDWEKTLNVFPQGRDAQNPQATAWPNPKEPIRSVRDDELNDGDHADGQRQIPLLQPHDGNEKRNYASLSVITGIEEKKIWFFFGSLCKGRKIRDYFILANRCLILSSRTELKQRKNRIGK